jgi:hypothetical protein
VSVFIVRYLYLLIFSYSSSPYYSSLRFPSTSQTHPIQYVSVLTYTYLYSILYSPSSIFNSSF